MFPIFVILGFFMLYQPLYASLILSNSWEREGYPCIHVHIYKFTYLCTNLHIYMYTNGSPMVLPAFAMVYNLYKSGSLKIGKKLKSRACKPKATGSIAAESLPKISTF